eukprot:gene5945-4601_t
MLLEAARQAGDVTREQAVIRILSYLDDLTLLAPAPLMGTAMLIAREELGAVGLPFNDVKSLVWTETGVCPPGCEPWWKGVDGFVLVGAPFGRLEAAVNEGDAADDTPDGAIDHDVCEMAIGTSAFRERFL